MATDTIIKVPTWFIKEYQKNIEKIQNIANKEFASKRGISVDDVFSPHISHSDAEDMFEASIKKHPTKKKTVSKKRRATTPAVHFHEDTCFTSDDVSDDKKSVTKKPSIKTNKPLSKSKKAQSKSKKAQSKSKKAQISAKRKKAKGATTSKAKSKKMKKSKKSQRS